jgi:hypothetical protein
MLHFVVFLVLPQAPGFSLPQFQEYISFETGKTSVMISMLFSIQASWLFFRHPMPPLYSATYNLSHTTHTEGNQADHGS